MTRSAYITTGRRLAAVTATASLAFLLTLSVSHKALAACTSIGAPGDTTVTCSPGAGETVTTGTGDDTVTATSGTTGAIYTDDGNDTISISSGLTSVTSVNAGAGDDTVTIGSEGDIGASAPTIDRSGNTNRRYSVTGGYGKDTITIYSGTFVGTVMGNADDDKLVIYGGDFQNVAGDGRASADGDNTVDALGNAVSQSVTGNDTITVYGGTINGEVQGGNGDDTINLYGGTINRVEGNNSTTEGGDVIYLDGASLGSWELPGGGAGGQTLYLRSGQFGVGAADDDDDDDDTPELAEHLVIDPGNSIQTNPKMLQIGSGLNFGAGDDSLTFIGAVGSGEGQNFEFTDDDIEFEGGDGEDSILITALVKGGVTTSSNVVLGELEGFENLTVSKGSKATLTDEEYEFEEKVSVDGTSELHLSGSEVEFTTEHLELLGGAGNGRLTGLPEYYDTFATGGVLRIGGLPGAGDEGEDDDDNDDIATLADDDDDDEEEGEGGGAGPVSVSINTGANTFVNGATITMMNGVVGDSLAINDHYDSQNGKLAIDTELGGSGSPTDNVTIDGPVTGTATTVYVNNVGGEGAFTGQGKTDGIEIATSATDAFSPHSFKLAINALTGKEEVVAGAFSYRLAVTDDAALLQSDILDQVPAYVTAPSVGQRLVSNGLDTLYKRLGEIRRGQNDGATSSDGLLWVRGNYSDVDVDADSGFDFSQRSSGVIAGAGTVIASEGSARLAVGIFGGYGNADAGVDAIIFGTNSASSINVDGWSVGGYATYYEAGKMGTGFYADTVVKADFLDFDMSARSRASHGSADGDALTASGEIGYGFGLGGGFVIQPQAQIAYTDLAIDSFTDAVPYNLAVSYGSNESLIGRLGLQLQANMVQSDGTVISPYALFNAYSEFEGNNRSDVNGVAFTSDVGGNWYSAGGGIDAKIAGSLSLYGSAEYHFGDVEGWQGNGGLKLVW